MNLDTISQTIQSLVSDSGIDPYDDNWTGRNLLPFISDLLLFVSGDLVTNTVSQIYLTLRYYMH